MRIHNKTLVITLSLVPIELLMQTNDSTSEMLYVAMSHYHINFSTSYMAYSWSLTILNHILNEALPLIQFTEFWEGKKVSGTVPNEQFTLINNRRLHIIIIRLNKNTLLRILTRARRKASLCSRSCTHHRWHWWEWTNITMVTRALVIWEVWFWWLWRKGALLEEACEGLHFLRYMYIITMWFIWWPWWRWH